MAAKVLHEGKYLYYKCPGCKHNHHIPPEEWNWNGDTEKPTLSPSVLHYYELDGQRVTTCHYFIREGKIQYCGDCQHELAGKTVDLPDFQ
jgi:hypothetical protein